MNSPSRPRNSLVGIVAVALAALVLALVVVSLVRGAGNAVALQSDYGRSMGSSVNGTGAFAGSCGTRATRFVPPGG